MNGRASALGVRSGVDFPRGFTVVIPFYNEANFILATLQSVLDQETAPARILLVDNASTDNSAALASALLEKRPDIPSEIAFESRPGKIFALEKASSMLETEFVAFCDADTFYPKDYLSKAAKLFASGGERTVGAMATGIHGDAESDKNIFLRRKTAFVGKLLAKQCHTGGYGQIFRTSAFLNAGGYDSHRWSYVLEDHEIVHRVLKFGMCRYNVDFWCRPSDRRLDRGGVSWTTFEQAIYHLTPFAFKDRFFYDFFAKRLEKRGMTNLKLRAQPWAENKNSNA